MEDDLNCFKWKTTSILLEKTEEAEFWYVTLFQPNFAKDPQFALPLPPSPNNSNNNNTYQSAG